MVFPQTSLYFHNVQRFKNYCSKCDQSILIENVGTLTTCSKPTLVKRDIQMVLPQTSLSYTPTMQSFKNHYPEDDQSILIEALKR